MKYDVLMFCALIATLAAIGLNAPDGVAAGNPAATVSPATQLQIAVNPSERVAVLENNYGHMAKSISELKDEFRRETKQIKSMIAAQNDVISEYILMILGALILGEHGIKIAKQIKGVKAK